VLMHAKNPPTQFGGSPGFAGYVTVLTQVSIDKRSLSSVRLHRDLTDAEFSAYLLVQ
jgi:hypothetical protein